MFVRSYVRYTPTPNDIMYRVTSGVIFKTDKLTTSLSSLEINLKKELFDWYLYLTVLDNYYWTVKND